MSRSDNETAVASSPTPASYSANLTAEMSMLEALIKDMIEGWRYQARVGSVSYSLLVLLYASMVLFGATGNLLVILVVVRNSAMRTARNVFIVNLAVSDLMLCLITMPLTLVEILYMTWQFGNYPAACPVAALLQGTSIFVSTLSITAIALDRRQLIVCPHKGAFGIKGMLACVPVIWLAAVGLASPMVIWKKLEYWTEWTNLEGILGTSQATTRDIDCPLLLNTSVSHYDNASGGYVYEEPFEWMAPEQAESERLNCMFKAITPRMLHELQSCKEDFPKHGRFIYSTVTMVIQYLLPTITISIAYYQIYGQLRIRMQQKMNQLATSSTHASNSGLHNSASVVNGGGGGGTGGGVVVERIENDIQRMRRTTNLLIWVGVMFCVCWLPLNIVNTVMDITEKHRIDDQGKKVKPVLTDEQYCILYAVCHVTGMLSACANPVIYGYLNENFNREFKDIFARIKQTCCGGASTCCSPSVEQQQQGGCRRRLGRCFRCRRGEEDKQIENQVATPLANNGKLDLKAAHDKNGEGGGDNGNNAAEKAVLLNAATKNDKDVEATKV